MFSKPHYMNVMVLQINVFIITSVIGPYTCRSVVLILPDFEDDNTYPRLVMMVKAVTTKTTAMAIPITIPIAIPAPPLRLDGDAGRFNATMKLYIMKQPYNI